MLQKGLLRYFCNIAEGHVKNVHMKKIFLHLFVLCLGTSFAYGQKNTSWIIPNPDYTKYMELKQAGQWNPPGTADFPLGYAPAPFTIRHNPTPAISGVLKSTEEELPDRYDLRDSGFVTTPKDQGSGSAGGNCTAFATMGALESRWLKTGLPEYDLSEQNLAACHGYEWGYGEGANQYICTAYLNRFSGPVLEEQDPYNLEDPTCHDTVPVALVPEARWLPGRDFQLLKEIIYHYGAVWVSVYWNNAGYDSDDNTYYNSESSPSNHAFLACGWDDTLSTDGGTGAWIVKNSWSTAWGDNGYVYVSYNDTKFAEEMAYFPVRWDTDEVDSLYIYDRLGVVKALGVSISNEVYELAKFEAPDEQLLTRVGVAVADPNTIIDIEIYDDFTGGQLSGLLAERSREVAEFAGYYTFGIPALVDGDFYVKIKRTVAAEYAFIPVEAFDEGYADPVIEEDVNWISTNGTNWESANPGTAHSGYNLSIRAYTSYDTGPKALFMANKTNACLESDVVFTFLENNPATSWTWDFGRDAEPANATGEGPHTVSYTSEGTKTVSLIVSGPGGQDTITREDYIRVTDGIDLIVPTTEYRIPLGTSSDISAYGADTYIWTPATILSSNTGHTVTATPPSEDTYEITVFGSQGELPGCSDQETITIISTIPPENDNMCDAVLISPGGLAGTYSNQNGTIESGEPAPEATDCYSDMAWCPNEPGPLHSVWFYFYGPETGTASIRTVGINDWDNQIAIYRADTCIGILEDSLVAANDDESASELAAIVDADVIPGEKYYLQMDGSGNSQEGSCELYFYAYPVGTDELWAGNVDDGLSVYPNPTGDVLNLRMSGVRSGRIDLFVYNISGQMVRTKSFSGLGSEFYTRIDMADSAAGIYYLYLIDGARVIHRKIIRE